MMMTCDEVRMSLGVYALGVLEPEERVLVEAHLAECAACRAEAEELGGVATLLGRVAEEDVAQAVSPPRAVLDRLLSERLHDERARKRRTSRALLAVAASIVVAGIGGAVWTAAGQPAADHPAAAPAASQSRPAASESNGFFRDRKAAPDRSSAPQRSAPSGSPDDEVRILLEAPQGREFAGRGGSARATVMVTAGAEPSAGPSAGSGASAGAERGGAPSTVTVTLTGVPGGTRCRLVTVGTDGVRRTAAEWTVGRAVHGSPGVAAGSKVTGTTTLRPEDVERFEIVAGGRVLIRLTPR
ncbi:zf-HC2 domain-containing protein [Streptosporangium sp. NPDC048047]|uniref:zf-HC2 domain-containing protein n=1 Tax=Streptosporangium sp. NPDC048047 TaxID=3155748 RepID=UPI00343397D8